MPSKAGIVEYRDIREIRGPLMIVRCTAAVSYDELVEVLGPDGSPRLGRVVEVGKDYAVVQVFEGTADLPLKGSRIRFLGTTLEIPVSEEMLGRVLNGRGEAMDGLLPPITDTYMDVNGVPMNPSMRDYPTDFIQTGVSVIDGMLTLVRGQKLPIFTGAGLTHNMLAAQIARQASIPGREEEFAVIFAAIGVKYDEAMYFRRSLEESGAIRRSTLVLNLAEDPVIERIITPRIALTIAEYLAYEAGMHVLIVLTDMTNYCEALRELSAAREEVPGRRGYPGYMYTDLASVYERAGRIKGRKGSITQMPILTMPADDITHPIPDLTGYVTEGQIVLSRALHGKGVYPPVDVLMCLSRLMKDGIGEGKTRDDHADASNQLYASYRRTQEVRDLATLAGEAALSSRDRMYLEFGNAFEGIFLSQDIRENRGIEETLDLAWRVLSILPDEELTRVHPEHIERRLKEIRERPLREEGSAG